MRERPRWTGKPLQIAGDDVTGRSDGTAAVSLIES